MATKPGLPTLSSMFANEGEVMQRRKKIRGAALGFAALVALAVTAAAPAGNSATITIRHQMRGCHSWSFNSGLFKPSLSVNVRPGTVLKITNNDVMPHKLVQTAGYKVAVRTPEHDEDGIVSDRYVRTQGRLPLHHQAGRGLRVGWVDEDGRRGQCPAHDRPGEVGSRRAPIRSRSRQRTASGGRWWL